jgi:RNA polymerase sigma-70 factor (ECF subfamily)
MARPAGPNEPVALETTIIEQSPPLVMKSRSDDATPDPVMAEMIRRARQGDEMAFERLVQHHERAVLRTALRLLGRRDLAEDASQETFLRLHRFLHRFDISRDLTPWLYRVVVNVCRDLARRACSPRTVSLETLRSGEAAEMRVDADHIEQNAGLAWERRLVQAALATLPEKERAAIVLRDIEGLPTREVARILGSSEGTVRSQVCTARMKIRRFVDVRMEGRS